MKRRLCDIKRKCRRFSRTTVGLRQVCSLSRVLFNRLPISLWKIMPKTVTPPPRPLCKMWFADVYVDHLRDSEEEFQRLADRLERTATGHGMEISSDKSKVLVNESLGSRFGELVRAAKLCVCLWHYSTSSYNVFLNTLYLQFSHDLQPFGWNGNEDFSDFRFRRSGGAGCVSELLFSGSSTVNI